MDGITTRRAATLRSLTIFKVEAGQDHARVIETTGPALIDSDLALFALIIPHTCRLVACAADKSRVGRVQVNLRDHV